MAAMEGVTVNLRVALILAAITTTCCGSSEMEAADAHSYAGGEPCMKQYWYPSGALLRECSCLVSATIDGHPLDGDCNGLQTEYSEQGDVLSCRCYRPISVPKEMVWMSSSPEECGSRPCEPDP